MNKAPDNIIANWDNIVPKYTPSIPNELIIGSIEIIVIKDANKLVTRILEVELNTLKSCLIRIFIRLRITKIKTKFKK